MELENDDDDTCEAGAGREVAARREELAIRVCCRI